MKTTEWFPPEIKPIRVGWYQRRLVPMKEVGALETAERLIWLNYFDGENWHHAWCGRKLAVVKFPYEGIVCDSDCCEMEWRGRAKEPK